MTNHIFNIDSTACFTRGNALSRRGGLMREKLFGQPLRNEGIRPSLPLVTGEKPVVTVKTRPAKAVQPTPATARVSKPALSDDRKPAPKSPRQRLPVEYKGHIISNTQHPDGNWVASFVKTEAVAESARRSASYVAGSMALADAKRQIDDAIALTDPVTARREFQRIPVALDGKMFDASGAHDCQILDLSAGGVRLCCADPTAVAGDLTLYVPGFGRYRASVIRRGDVEMSLRFAADGELILSLLKGLSGYVKGYSFAQTKLRRETRIAAPIATVCRGMDGAAIPCEIINASMRGMSLAMAHRPQIGTLVTLGRTQVRVVRHHDQGIAIEYLSAPGAKTGRYVFSH